MRRFSSPAAQADITAGNCYQIRCPAASRRPRKAGRPDTAAVIADLMPRPWAATTGAPIDGEPLRSPIARPPPPSVDGDRLRQIASAGRVAGVGQDAVLPVELRERLLGEMADAADNSLDVLAADH